MSQLEQIREYLKEVIDQVYSEDLLREVTTRLEAQNSKESAEIDAPELLARLRKSEEDYKAGRHYSLEEAKAMMEARHPYLRKA